MFWGQTPTRARICLTGDALQEGQFLLTQGNRVEWTAHLPEPRYGIFPDPVLDTGVRQLPECGLLLVGIAIYADSRVRRRVRDLPALEQVKVLLHFALTRQRILVVVIIGRVRPQVAIRHEKSDWLLGKFPLLRHEREARPEKLCLNVAVTVIAGRVEYQRSARPANSSRRCQSPTMRVALVTHRLSAKWPKRYVSCAERSRLLSGMAEAHHLSGDWEEAKACVRRALYVAQVTGWPYDEGLARLVVEGPEAG